MSANSKNALMGYDICLNIGGSPAALGTKVSFENSRDMIDCSVKEDGMEGSKKAGKINRNINFEGYNLATGEGGHDLNVMMDDGTEIDWEIVPSADLIAETLTTVNLKKRSGKATIASVSEDYGISDLGTYSCSLEVNGGVTYEDVSGTKA